MSPALAGRFLTTAPPGKPRTSFYEEMSWSLGVESGETLRGHFRKGATALIGTEEVVAICLGYLACRKKLEWLIGGSVEGPELNLMDLGLGAAPVRATGSRGTY